MADIRISLNEVSNIAASLRNRNQMLDEVLSEITSTMNQMEEGWSSESSRAILSAYNEFSRVFIDESEVINEYAKFLDDTVMAYESLESTLSSNAGNFNGQI